MTDTTNQNPTIQLSDESIEEIVSLCELIRRKNPRNEISVNMAKGIAEYASHQGLVTHRQAMWLCRNADHWKITRPTVLADVTVEHVVSPKTPAAEEVATSRAVSSQASNDLVDRLTERLERIEKLLEERL